LFFFPLTANKKPLFPMVMEKEALDIVINRPLF